MFPFAALHWLLVTLSVLGKMFVAGAFEVLYILSGELFPTVVRNVGLGTSSAWARAGSMLSPYIAKLVSEFLWYFIMKLLIQFVVLCLKSLCMCIQPRKQHPPLVKIKTT